MNLLILSQKISDIHVEIVKNALPSFCKIEIITGSTLVNNLYIKAPSHNPRNIYSRLNSWYLYYRFVIRYLKNTNEKFDLVFATSNPPINAYLGLWIKKKYQCKFIYMNWDLYPEVIENTMKGGVVYVISMLWHRLNCYIYPQIDQMLTIGNVMAMSINSSLKSEIPIEVVPMFTDTSLLKPIAKKNNEFCIANNISDKFIVLYSGKMGLGHNLEILLEASRFLREYSNILFLFIGYGQKYSIIEKWIKDENASNVKIMPLQKEEVFPKSMASGDIGFVSQEKKMSKFFMPAKVYDMMACGMAILTFSEGNDDLSDLVKKHELGISISQNSPELIADTIKKIYNDRKLLNRYKSNSRVVAKKYFDINPITERYKKIFQKVIGCRG